MLIPNHPDDERLSAMASRDDDALADAELVAHLSACTRCTDLVAELGAIRVSLAALPDLVPDRPLRLLPPADEVNPTSDGIGAWARRVFAPLMTAGAALALVGAVGTGAPVLSGGLASGDSAQPGNELQEFSAGGDDGGAAPDMPNASAGGEEPASVPDAEATDEDSNGVSGYAIRTREPAEEGDGSGSGEVDRGGDLGAELPAERSPWPMVLFTGVALIVAAALLRWILVPRAG